MLSWPSWLSHSLDVPAAELSGAKEPRCCPRWGYRCIDTYIYTYVFLFAPVDMANFTMVNLTWRFTRVRRVDSPIPKDLSKHHTTSHF